MYCQKCKAALTGTERICPGCGMILRNPVEDLPNNTQNLAFKKIRLRGLEGFFALALWLISWVLWFTSEDTGELSVLQGISMAISMFGLLFLAAWIDRYVVTWRNWWYLNKNGWNTCVTDINTSVPVADKANLYCGKTQQIIAFDDQT